MTTAAIALPTTGPDAALTVRELLLELARVEDAEMRGRPLPGADDERRRRASLRRRGRQLVAEIGRRRRPR